jgi:hypothetical protein
VILGPAEAGEHDHGDEEEQDPGQRPAPVSSTMRAR